MYTGLDTSYRFKHTRQFLQVHVCTKHILQVHVYLTVLMGSCTKERSYIYVRWTYFFFFTKLKEVMKYVCKKYFLFDFLFNIYILHSVDLTRLHWLHKSCWVDFTLNSPDWTVRINTYTLRYMLCRLESCSVGHGVIWYVGLFEQF